MCNPKTILPAMNPMTATPERSDDISPAAFETPSRKDIDIGSRASIDLRALANPDDTAPDMKSLDAAPPRK